MSSASKIEINTELLRRLHRIHRQRSDLKSQLERGPRQIKAGEALVAKAQAETEQCRQSLQKAKMAADEKQLQLKSRELRIEDMKTKLNTASSNREFSTLKEQIAADQQANSVLSDEILEALEGLDVMESELVSLDSALAQAQSEQQDRKVSVEQKISALSEELARVEGELKTAETEIPAAAKIDYVRLTQAKGEDALAPVDGGSCGGCFQVLTTNLIDRLRMSTLIRCPNCNAFLYLAEDSRVK